MQNGTFETVDDENVKNVTVNGYSDHGSRVEDEGQDLVIQNGAPQPPDEGARDDSDSTRGKKRKLAEINESKRSRGTSPPWKRVEAEGPSSFQENGRRKSGRTNMVPLELQPQSDKRQTRGAIQRSQENKQKSTRSWLSKNRESRNDAPSKSRTSTRTQGSTETRRIPHTMQQTRRSTQFESNSRRINGFSHHSPKASRSHAQSSGTSDPLRASTRTRSDRSTRAQAHLSSETRQTQRTRTQSISPTLERSPIQIRRLRLNFRPPPMAIVNPGNLVPPRKYSSFQECLENDDPLEGEDIRRYTQAEARQKALALVRLEDAAKPGGVFSQDRWTENEVEPPSDPAAYYTHPDYLFKHIENFRQELDKEKRFHRANAKKLALACLEKWKFKQPKTEEDLLLEVQKRAEFLYKETVKRLKTSWAMVEEEVKKEKLKQYQEEQMARGKQAMGQFVEHSGKLMLMRRNRYSALDQHDDQAEDESSIRSDEEETGSSRTNTDDESSDSDEMSSDESEEEEAEEGSAAGDDQLSAEQLRLKYAAVLDDDKEEASRNEDSMIEDVDLDRSMQDTEMESFFKHDSPLDSSMQAEDFGPVDHEKYSDQEIPATDSHETFGIDPSQHPLDEVDSDLLDSDEDESGSGSSDDSDESGTSDDEGTSENGSEQSEVDGNAPTFGMMGFFSKKQISALKSQSAEETDEQDVPTSDRRSASMSPDTSTRFNAGHDPVNSDELPKLEDSSRPQTPADVSTSNQLPSSESLDRDQSEAPANALQEHPSSIKTEIPFLLRGQLREYQHEGLDWLAGLYDCDTNGILADEMGLGKTIQTIALLAYLAVERHVWGPHLIVVPTSVMLNWEMEFKKWCPGFKILTYYGNQEERKMKRKGWMDNDRWHVCITSYQLALQDAQSLKRRDWHYLILDEAHNIKNFRSQRWQTLLSFKSQARLLLTGTPLQNNLSELWSLLFFLNPELDEEGNLKFGDLSTFSRAFNRPVDQIMDQGREILDEDSRKIVAKLHSVLRPHLLRRLKVDVEKQMPMKYEHIVKCRLSKRQRQLYDGYMGLAGTRESFSSGNYMSIINCLMQLRKVCNHPDLFETRQIVTSYAMSKSAVADYEIKELLVRRNLLREQDRENERISLLNLWAPNHRNAYFERGHALAALQPLYQASYHQSVRLRREPFNGKSIESALNSLDSRLRDVRLQEINQLYVYTWARPQRRPVYGKSLLDTLAIRQETFPLKKEPTKRSRLTSWYLNRSTVLQECIVSRQLRSQLMETTIQKFGCITPAVVAPEMTRLALTDRGMDIVNQARTTYPEDNFHEARVRLSIAFPDKSLIQYDCGKLQQLDRLLRQLQAGGHRALIFTQMTKVLDILEQFLNLHGHRYLRLDGATKIEQRQILTDRFNNDTRILAFILSSRSGGLGINLTGADTVIFYDLDWNPAMDKQCQDRCHRIGQTRDVHIYRFVSEGTIEANILRKSNQKRMLDDVVIQEGEFTTDYFNRIDYKELIGEVHDGDAEADAALDKVLGNRDIETEKALQQAEGKEDHAAATQAQREYIHTDDADFEDKPVGSGGMSTPKTDTPNTPAGESSTPAAADEDKVEEEYDEQPSWEDYMLRYKRWEYRDTIIIPPSERKKKKDKKGKDKGIKAHRRR